MGAGHPDLDERLEQLTHRLLDRRASADHWDGHLASSALSTATAALALHVASANGYRSNRALDQFVSAGARWLIAHQNTDGGWGDTVRSRSNISTTALVWAALSTVAEPNAQTAEAI